MELRTKKVLLIVAFLGSVFLFGYLIYFFFFRIPPSELPITNEGVPTGVFPPVGLNANIPLANLNINAQFPIANINAPQEVQPSPVALGGITKTSSVVSEPTQDVTMSSNGRDISYYNKNDNTFYKIDENGNIKKLSDKKFFNVEKTYWANDTSKAIVQYPDKTKVMYDFNEEKQYTIPSHWEEFDFAPDNNQITTKSMGIDPETRYLITANANGSQAKRIEPMGNNYNKVTPTWSPTNQIIATYAEGRDLNRQDVYLIGKNKENFKSLVVEGRGFESEWSPTGSHLLYSVYNSDTDYNPTLWITEASGERIGQGRKPLELNTWAHKCNFSSASKIYCAVPVSLEKGSGLYPEISNTTPDNLYEINLNTGTKSLIAVPEESTNIKNIMVSQNGKYLYYTNSNTGEILKINLR